MRDLYTSLHLITDDNPYPDCVSFKWETSSQRTQIVSPEKLFLMLSMCFNKQGTSLLKGYLEFGIKGGILTLQTENGEVINSQPFLANWGQLQTCSSLAVVWQLASPTRLSILQTESIFSPFVVIQPLTDTISITITLEVTSSDLSIIKTEGLWRHYIPPNKHTVLERVLSKFLYESRLSNYFCQIKLTSDLDRVVESENRPKEEIDLQALTQLQDILERLYAADTDHLHELMALGNLDPLKDLAGGNFLATELSGTEFGGANLSRTNFRGANLTDADLSEAILNYSRFSGADLSGVLLGNAQLVEVNFYRASLALANLIGANLTGADLREANLSQTNFAGATVIGAKFGENPGMTEEMKISLGKRGAIFVGSP